MYKTNKQPYLDIKSFIKEKYSWHVLLIIIIYMYRDVFHREINNFN